MNAKIKGMATIAISLALLLGASILAVYSTQSSVAEQKVTGNEFRVKQAFEAADAGMNKAIMYLSENRAELLVDNDADGNVDTISIADMAGGTLPNNATYAVTLSNPISGDMSVLTITSTGTSVDGEVTRTVSQSYANETILNGKPPTPFTAKGNINLSGTLDINNFHTSTSIWSGGTVGYAGNAKSCNSSVCSNRGGTNSDVSESDATLSSMSSDDFFQNFFGTSKESLKQGAQYKYTSSDNTNYSDKLDGLTNKLIWIDQSGGGEAQINSNTVIGSPDEPVVVIIQGDFHLNGTAKIYGVVYVDNDWNNTGGGTLDVQGSVIINGAYSGNGTPNIEYDPNVLIKVADDIGYFTKVSGSWRDF